MKTVCVDDVVRHDYWEPGRNALVLAVSADGRHARVHLPEVARFGVEWWVPTEELTLVEPGRSGYVGGRFWVGLGNALLLTGLAVLLACCLLLSLP